MGRAINMENQIDTAVARLEILEKRVKLLELQQKAALNDKITQVIELKEEKLSKAEKKDLIDRGLVKPKKVKVTKGTKKVGSVDATSK